MSEPEQPSHEEVTDPGKDSSVPAAAVEDESVEKTEKAPFPVGSVQAMITKYKTSKRTYDRDFALRSIEQGRYYARMSRSEEAYSRTENLVESLRREEAAFMGIDEYSFANAGSGVERPEHLTCEDPKSDAALAGIWSAWRTFKETNDREGWNADRTSAFIAERERQRNTHWATWDLDDGYPRKPGPPSIVERRSKFPFQLGPYAGETPDE